MLLIDKELQVHWVDIIHYPTLVKHLSMNNFGEA